MAEKNKTTKKTASKAPKKLTATAKIQQLEKRISQLEQMVTGTRPAGAQRPQPRPMPQRPQPRSQMAQGGRPQMPMQGAPRGPQGPSRPMGGMRPGGMA
jgi:hypothetical protein